MHSTTKTELRLNTLTNILLNRISSLTDKQAKEEFRRIITDRLIKIDDSTRTKLWDFVNGSKGRVELMMNLCNLHLI